jgi:hypothetical protein
MFRPGPIQRGQGVELSILKSEKPLKSEALLVPNILDDGYSIYITPVRI